MNRSLDAIILRYVGYALVFLFGAYMLYLARGALPIFLTAGLLAYALDPLLRRLEARGYSRAGAVGFVALVCFLVFLLLLTLLASAWQQAQELATDFPQYERRVTEIIDVNRNRLDQMRLPENVKKSIHDAINDFQQRAPQTAASWLQNALGWVFGSLGTIGITLIVVPILTLYMMMEMNPIRARLLMLVPPIYRRDVIDISSSINELLGRYVRGQIIVCGLFGVLCTIAFSILGRVYGMEYTIIIGCVAGFLYVVPYLGMATIAASAALTAYFTADHAPLACASIAVGCCVVFNLIIDYGVSPRVLGKGVGLHPLMVIFALLSGAQVGGIFGMILAVPFFASLRVVLIYLFPQLSAPIEPASPESQPPPSKSATTKIAEHTAEVERETEDEPPRAVEELKAAS